MKKYVKNLKEYAKVEFDEKKVLAAAKRLKAARKLPTSIALEKRTIEELRELADAKGVPYQILMRMFVLDGIRRLKKTAS